MTIRKIDLMHREFGVSPGNKCKTCSNFWRGRYHDRMYSKCAVYGMTHSEASDWSGRYDACGLYGREWEHGDVMRMVTPNSMAQEQIDGQETIF